MSSDDHSKSEYPLTHFIEQQTEDFHRQKRKKFLEYSRYSSYFFIGLLFYSCFPFNYHIRFYNEFFGPFHLTLSEFVDQVNHFDRRSLIWRKEFFQIELGEKNLINSSNPQEVIRQYSNSDRRDQSIAVFKRVRQPKIFIKLPTRHRQYFHHRFRFHFNSFSISTLQCILKRISNEKFFEKADFVRFIDEFYQKNSTQFNVLVVSHCAIFIGYLSKPKSDRVFLAHREYQFKSDDFIFDSSQIYASKFFLIVQTILFLFVFIVILTFWILCLINLIRCYLHRRGIVPLPLRFSFDIQEELWLLNFDLSLIEQIFLLDRFIRQTEFNWKNRLFIIRKEGNDDENLFVVLLRVDLNRLTEWIDKETSPFIICPVNQIKRIVHDRGIAYGRDDSWIPWPFGTPENEENQSQWLHNTLMQISDVYLAKYENRLRDRSTNHWTRFQRENLGDLSRLIREEENFQHLQIERQTMFTLLIPSSISASPQFIARFRYENSQRRTLCDEQMDKEEHQCSICLEMIRFEENYAQWPCPSDIRHLFHFDCMWQHLRMNNTCPLCRHPVESFNRFHQFYHFGNFLFT